VKIALFKSLTFGNSATVYLIFSPLKLSKPNVFDGHSKFSLLKKVDGDVSSLGAGIGN
jgi:hypothetical protein